MRKRGGKQVKKGARERGMMRGWREQGKESESERSKERERSRNSEQGE